MFDGMSTGIQVVLMVVALTIALVLLFWVFRKVAGSSSIKAPANRRPRLAVTDAAVVDDKRRLVLVRRDDVEHLVMIGGPTDIVVESNVVRIQPTALARAEAIPQPLPQSAEPEQPAVHPGNQQQGESMPAAMVAGGAAVAAGIAATAAVAAADTSDAVDELASSTSEPSGAKVVEPTEIEDFSIEEVLESIDTSIEREIEPAIEPEPAPIPPEPEISPPPATEAVPAETIASEDELFADLHDALQDDLSVEFTPPPAEPPVEAVIEQSIEPEPEAALAPEIVVETAMPEPETVEQVSADPVIEQPAEPIVAEPEPEIDLETALSSHLDETLGDLESESAPEPPEPVVPQEPVVETQAPPAPQTPADEVAAAQAQAAAQEPSPAKQESMEDEMERLLKELSGEKA